MTFLEAMAAVLWADAGFKAASPGGIAAQLTPEAPTQTLTSYRVIGGPNDPTLDTAGLQVLRVEFNCHAMTYNAASAARDALVAFLNGYGGQLADARATYLQNAQVLSPMDFFDSETRQHRCMTEFYLIFD